MLVMNIKTGEQDTHRSSIDDQNKGFYELKKRKDKLQGERNDLCRKEMNLQQSLSSLKEDLSKVSTYLVAILTCFQNGSLQGK